MQAVKKGIANAMYCLGVLYKEQGKLVEAETYWLQAAIKHGHADAQHNLEILCEMQRARQSSRTNPIDPRDKYVGKWTFEHYKGRVSLCNESGQPFDWIDKVSGGSGEVFISKSGENHLKIGNLLYELNGNELWEEGGICVEEFNFHIVKSLPVQYTSILSGIIKHDKLIIFKERHEGNTAYMDSKLIGEHIWVYRKIN